MDQMAKSTSKTKALRPIVLLTLVSLLICGMLFPLFVTGVSQILFPAQANGSLASLSGRAVGSYYIDNGFTLPIFFHARNETNLQTSSASGVDPDISLQDALSQVPRIHDATGIPDADLKAIVMSHEKWTLGYFGDPYVNVLELNLALISSYGTTYASYR